jgi:4-carboxymuconolactone decarboxylase
MKKLLFLMALLTANLFNQLMAQNANSIFPKGEISTTDNHTGTIWLNELSKPDSIFSYSIAVAAFAPNSKLDWHIHPAGQILLISEGTGYYQEKGKSIQIVHKGDVIKCLPNVEHWHGASPDHTFAYIATTPAQKGKTIWLKRVSEDEYKSVKSPINKNLNEEDEIKNLSKNKWQWMADKNVDELSKLFDEKSVFVHMGGSWGKEREIDIIKGGMIHYKKADIHEVSVKIVDNTAILLNKITLLAVVGGNEVINPFQVTEVYVKQNGTWKLGSLSFTKLLTP